MTFSEIRIIATGPCIGNQLRDASTICRRSWYIAAHIRTIYDFKIEVIPFIINLSTELITVVKNNADEAVSVFSLISSSREYIDGRNSANLGLLINTNMYVQMSPLYHIPVTGLINQLLVLY